MSKPDHPTTYSRQAHRPLAAILDPELTLGSPRTLTAWIGCNALVHAINELSAN